MIVEIPDLGTAVSYVPARESWPGAEPLELAAVITAAHSPVYVDLMVTDEHGQTYPVAWAQARPEGQAPMELTWAPAKTLDAE
jgi:hypothetical protein